jgi:hypothetical protein
MHPCIINISLIARISVTSHRQNIQHESKPGDDSLDVANLCGEVVQLLLDLGVLLGHLLVLRLPLVAILLKGLDFALKVASFNICLTES